MIQLVVELKRRALRGLISLLNEMQELYWRAKDFCVYTQIID